MPCAWPTTYGTVSHEARPFVPADVPSTFHTTVDAVHAIAEHVLCVARYDATGRVGLRPTVDGVETPPFGPTDRVVGIDGDELVDRDADGERRAPITTIDAAARFFDVEAGVPGGLWTPATRPQPHRLLEVDRAAVQALADWYAVTAAALAGLAEAGAELEPLTLWPEGFDLATAGGGVNFGGSPGDRRVGVPYLYVGPHRRPFPATADDFWNEPFGAAVRHDEIDSVDDATAFLVRGFHLTRAG